MEAYHYAKPKRSHLNNLWEKGDTKVFAVQKSISYLPSMQAQVKKSIVNRWRRAVSIRHLNGVGLFSCAPPQYTHVTTINRLNFIRGEPSKKGKLAVWSARHPCDLDMQSGNWYDLRVSLDVKLNGNGCSHHAQSQRYHVHRLQEKANIKVFAKAGPTSTNHCIDSYDFLFMQAQNPGREQESRTITTPTWIGSGLYGSEMCFPHK